MMGSSHDEMSSPEEMAPLDEMALHDGRHHMVTSDHMLRCQDEEIASHGDFLIKILTPSWIHNRI